MLSEAAIRALKEEMGWWEDRYINTTVYERAIKEAGFPFYPLQQEFLARFGFRSQKKIDGWPVMHFNPLAITRYVRAERWADLAEVFGSMPSPLGEYYHRSEPLCMIESGAIYSIYDIFMIMFGRTGEEAIECIMVHGQYQTIDYP